MSVKVRCWDAPSTLCNLAKVTTLYNRDRNDVCMINGILVIILLVKDEHIDIIGLYFLNQDQGTQGANWL